MADYKEMYLALFRSQTKAIEILQAAQQKTEQMYEDADDTPIDIAEIQQQNEKE